MLILVALTAVLCALLTCVPFLVRRMARMDICFTFPITNTVKYVERGGGRNADGIWENGILDHYLPEVPGYVLQGNDLRDMKFEKDGTGRGQRHSLLNNLLHWLLGVYWYGLYPFKHIRSFPIKRVHENLLGTGPKDWIESIDTVTVTALRHAFPRPFVFTDVELADRLTVELKIVMEFEVVKPYLPVYVYNGDFFTQAGSLLQGEVIDLLKEKSVDNFVKSNKGEIKGMLSGLKEENGSFNQKLIELVGLRVVSVSINDYNPGDKEVIEAIRQKALAQQKGEALVMAAEQSRKAELINADRDAQALLVRTKADVARQNALAESRSNYVRQTTAALVLPGSDPNVVSSGAADILAMEAVSSDSSKIQTLVRDRTAVTVPVGERK